MSTPLPTPLSEDQIDTYYREGYIVVPGLVPQATCDAILAAGPQPESFAGASNWSPLIFHHETPQENAAVHRMLVDPHIIGAVQQVFEDPARVFYGMLAVVPAHGGKGLPWHQDNQYTTILGRALNTFVAVDDIAPQAAILWVSPRSHTQGTYAPQEAEGLGGHRTIDFEPDNAIALPAMKKGDVCIFDRNTLHRSLTNETDAPRYAYAAQYMEQKARLVSLEGKKDPTRMLATDLMDTLKAELVG